MFHQIHRAQGRDEHFPGAARVSYGPAYATEGNEDNEEGLVRVRSTGIHWTRPWRSCFIWYSTGATSDAERSAQQRTWNNYADTISAVEACACIAPRCARRLVNEARAHESAGWFAGIGIVVLLGAAYVGEEIVWMVQNRGRPCGGCGQRIRLRPFSLRIHCPHCGRLLE